MLKLLVLLAALLADAPALAEGPAPAPAIGVDGTPATPPPAAPADAAPVRSFNVGVLDDAPPFSALGRLGVRSGFDIDVALVICSRLAADCNILPLAPEDIVAAMRDRRVDFAVASLSPTDAIDDAVDFKAPYVRIAVRLVVPRDAGAVDQAATPVYAKFGGSGQAEDIVRLKPANTAVRLYTDSEEMWIDLALGRVAAIAIRRGHPELKGELDRALADLLAAPEYDELLARHLDTDVAGPPPRRS